MTSTCSRPDNSCSKKFRSLPSTTTKVNSLSKQPLKLNNQNNKIRQKTNPLEKPTFFIFYKPDCPRSLRFLKKFHTIKPSGKWKFICIYDGVIYKTLPIKIDSTPCIYNVSAKEIYYNDYIYSFIESRKEACTAQKSDYKEFFQMINDHETDMSKSFDSPEVQNNIISCDVGNYYTSDFVDRPTIHHGATKSTGSNAGTKYKMLDQQRQIELMRQQQIEKELQIQKQKIEAFQPKTPVNMNKSNSNVNMYDPSTDSHYQLTANHSNNNYSDDDFSLILSKDEHSKLNDAANINISQEYSKMLNDRSVDINPE
jgi:hypothetical protein